MFTGIITHTGRILSVSSPDATEGGGDTTAITIACSLPPSALAIGASIACSGICLTIAESGKREGEGSWFRVHASEETRRCTTLVDWRPHRHINLETSLQPSSSIDGHFVFGHVDATSTILSMDEIDGCLRVWLDAPAELAPCIAPKCSIALDGVSLTVNEIRDSATEMAGGNLAFRIEIIPHTRDATTWRHAREGDRLNLEIDMLARYVARNLQFANRQPPAV